MNLLNLSFFILIIFFNHSCSTGNRKNTYLINGNVQSKMENYQTQFMCDYYIKHIKYLDNSNSLNQKSKILGRIKLSCDDSLSVQKELLKIFKHVNEDVDNSNYLPQ